MAKSLKLSDVIDFVGDSGNLATLKSIDKRVGLTNKNIATTYTHTCVTAVTPVSDGPKMVKDGYEYSFFLKSGGTCFNCNSCQGACYNTTCVGCTACHSACNDSCQGSCHSACNACNGCHTVCNNSSCQSNCYNHAY